MPKYSYLAKTKDAKTIKEKVYAVSQDELISRLRVKGLFVISVKEIDEKRESSSLFSLFSGKKGKRASLKPYDLALFARNLATTLSSGVTLLRSLEILSVQVESSKLEKILKECSTHIKEGLSLSEAINRYPGVFSSLWRGLVDVGEVSGNLPFVLDKLADYLEVRIDFERKIKSALIYPAILCSVSILAVFVFFKFILPKFTSLFEQFDIELPLPTQIIFGLSNLFEKNFLLIMLGLAALIGGFILFTRRPETGKIWEKIKLALPVIGKLTFLTALEKLTSTIYILLDSGLPLVYTLEVAARSTGSFVLEKNILSVAERVRDGASLSGELGKLNIFPLLIPEMAKIGEETGTMPQVFQKVSSHYQRDLTTRVERLIATFEPLMIVFIGIVIGGIVISLFLPLFKLSTLGA